jgi:multiple sugar transport system permease protein
MKTVEREHSRQVSGQTTAARVQRRIPKRQHPAASTLFYVLLVMVALVFVVPLLWPIFRSFEPNLLVTAAPSGQDFSHLTLANYRLLFSGSVDIFRYVLNSAIVTVGAAVLTCFLATLAGMGFGRYRFRGANAVFLLILATLMIPFQAILTPMFLEMHDLHLLNNLAGLILVYTTFNLPFGLFVMRNSFRQIPQEVEESAVVDGARTRQILTRVMGPLVVPGMITVCIYTFLFSWTEFLAALTFLTSNDVFTLPIELLNLQQNGALGQVSYALLEAGAVIAMVPVVVVYLALQRYYVAGFFSGAVKG